MARPRSSSSSSRPPPLLVSFFLVASVLQLLLPLICGLGSMATIAATYFVGRSSNITAHRQEEEYRIVAVCVILQGSAQHVQCWDSKLSDRSQSEFIPSPDRISFLGLSGGYGLLCGLRSDTRRPVCWAYNTANATAGGLFSAPKRLSSARFSQIAVGDAQVCGLLDDTDSVVCWRATESDGVPVGARFRSISCGKKFSCGLMHLNGSVICWGGGDSIARYGLPETTAFMGIRTGGQHACGITNTRHILCWGDNSFGQARVVSPSEKFVALALGDRHSCAIQAIDHRLACWGDNSFNQMGRSLLLSTLSFSAITAGDFFTCGIVESNSTVFCWGDHFGKAGVFLPLQPAIPAPCTTTPCDFNMFAYTNNSSVCAGNSGESHLCLLCRVGCPQDYYESSECSSEADHVCTRRSNSTINSASSSSMLPAVIYRTHPNAAAIASIVLGSVGGIIGLISICSCLLAKAFGMRMRTLRWRCICTCNGGQVKVHHSIQSMMGIVAARRGEGEPRSSTSADTWHRDIGTRCFSLNELAHATCGFAEENRVGAGSFGVVYRGELPDGRKVAVKRGDKMEAVEVSFRSELEFLSRVHHKHLVNLVGYCQEQEECILVYEYIPNGSLHDHLHKYDAVKLTWQSRLKIALEAARGIEYLHMYASPPIIHRDIKSSNILLDSSLVAHVSDFGLSLEEEENNNNNNNRKKKVPHLSLKVAGTIGYMDPEYYRLQHLTSKSDVYSFGVVLLEMLTGQRAIQKREDAVIVNVVDLAVPCILGGNMVALLDPRLPTPHDVAELEALCEVARVAEECVRLEGCYRPNMTEIVRRLEHATTTILP